MLQKITRNVHKALYVYIKTFTCILVVCKQHVRHLGQIHRHTHFPTSRHGRSQPFPPVHCPRRPDECYLQDIYNYQKK